MNLTEAMRIILPDIHPQQRKRFREGSLSTDVQIRLLKAKGFTVTITAAPPN